MLRPMRRVYSWNDRTKIFLDDDILTKSCVLVAKRSRGDPLGFSRTRRLQIHAECPMASASTMCLKLQTKVIVFRDVSLMVMRWNKESAKQHFFGAS